MLRLRYSNSGPEAKPEGAGGILADFATYIEQAGLNLTYTTPAASAVYSSLIATNPVIPGTSAEIVLARPSSAPPPGYRWAIKAHFTAAVRYQNSDGGAPINLVCGMQLQMSEDGASYVPLSTTLSATSNMEIRALDASDDVTESVALHGTRVFAGDTWQGDEGIIVRAAWGCPTTNGSARINTGDEGETGGWDFTAGWVLTPINAVLPPSP